MIRVKCPHCGAVLSVPEEYKYDKQLHCGICNQNFNYTYTPPKKRTSETSSFNQNNNNELSLKGKIITTIVIFALCFWGYGACQNLSKNRIQDDGKTVYVVIRDIVAPAAEEDFKKFMKGAANNEHDEIGMTAYMLNHDISMTALSAGDRVVVVRHVFGTYKVRRLSDYSTAIVPNGDCLRKE